MLLMLPENAGLEQRLRTFSSTPQSLSPEVLEQAATGQ